MNIIENNENKMPFIEKILRILKSKIVSFFSIALSLGLIFWIIDSYINAYFISAYDYKEILYSFIYSLFSESEIYSRILAVFLLLLLGKIASLSRKQVIEQNKRLGNLKKQLEESNLKLKEQLFRDSLTNAINRQPFIELLEKKLLESERKKSKFAILFADLEKFKQINDLFGHYVGDKVLILVSERITNSIRRSDFVGRYGGDEFIVCLNDIKDKKNIPSIISKIVNCFNGTINIDGHSIKLRLNIGIAVYPEDGNSICELLENSDKAMYHAKSKKMSYYFYS